MAEKKKAEVKKAPAKKAAPKKAVKKVEKPVGPLLAKMGGKPVMKVELLPDGYVFIQDLDRTTYKVTQEHFKLLGGKM